MPDALTVADTAPTARSIRRMKQRSGHTYARWRIFDPRINRKGRDIGGRRRGIFGEFSSGIGGPDTQNRHRESRGAGLVDVHPMLADKSGIIRKASSFQLFQAWMPNAGKE